MSPGAPSAHQLSKAIAFVYRRAKEVLTTSFYRFWAIEWGLMDRVDHLLDSWPVFGSVLLAFVIVFFLIRQA